MVKYFDDILDFDRGSPEELYNLYMNSEKHAAIFKQNIMIGTNVGDSVSLYNATSYNSFIRGRNLSIIPNRIIIQSLRSETWNKNVNDAVVIIKFIKFKGGTRIRLVNANLPDNELQVVDRGMFFDLWRIYIRGDRDLVDSIVNTVNKVRIMKLFIFKKGDFIVSVKEIAKLSGITVHAAYAALRDLYNREILKRDIIGKRHFYKLNKPSIIVRNIIEPVFKREVSI
jgi:predicted DNA-binding transcriptional regulator